MKKSVKIIAGIVVVAALAVIILPRLLRKEPPIEAQPAPNVTVSSPVIGDITLESGLIGTIEASDTVYVLPKTAGDIAEVLVKEGQAVTQGQALCRIDNSKQVDSARIQMDTALVSMQNAQASLNRMQVLYSTGDISAQAFEQTQLQAQSAALQYQAAKLAYDTQVEYGTVTAPISGTIESMNMEAHNTVSQSSQLCVITGEGGKKVTFSVPERIKNHISLGDRIRLEKQGTEYEAVITKMGNMISPASGLFDVEASVDKGDGLATGSTVKLYVVSDEADGAVTIPVDAVYYDGGDAYVYTCEGTTVHKVPVETGIFDSEKIEILSGIDMDDSIIITWTSELYEGAQVNPRTAEEAAAAAESQAQAAGIQDGADSQGAAADSQGAAADGAEAADETETSAQ